MLSYTAGSSDEPLRQNTIGADFEAVVARFGDRDALIEAVTSRRWNYTELNDEVNRLARGLLAAGIEKGDRVGIWSPNCAEWTILQYATAKIGAVLVNVNPAYRTSELEFVVNQCGMRMLVTAPADRTSDYPAMARHAASLSSHLSDLVMLPDAMAPGSVPGKGAATGERQDGGGSGTSAGERQDGGGGADNSAGASTSDQPGGHLREVSYAALVAGGDGVDPALLRQRMDRLDAHDPINLQYTSGTTGFPKGATLTHHNILNNGFSIGELLNYTEADRVVIPVPFYHCFGMVIGNLNALSHGAATIIPGRGFNPAQTLAAVQQYGGTSLYGVPTMFIAELALENFADYDLSTLRTGVMAGSPCPEEVMKRVISEMNMAGVAICYGMTETSPVSTMTRPDDTIERRTGTVGRTMPHLESQIVDLGTDVQVECGEIGELCTRGYSVMSGYWDQPDKTVEAITNDGWMRTGDLARMDTDGYIEIEGRIKDMVIRGGENVYPREIEEYLYRHPSVQDVQVIGVPDARYGEELMACIILKPDAEPLTVEDVIAFCRGKLAHYKIPRYVEVREEFPMTVSGKIRKMDMRVEAVAKLGL